MRDGEWWERTQGTRNLNTCCKWLVVAHYLRRMNEQLYCAQLTVEDQRNRARGLDKEVKQLKAALAKEKQKAKTFWCEKCEQQLVHKDALDKKDQEIK